MDAHAQGQTIGLGGWLPIKGPSGRLETASSPWFALSLTESEAPWAFTRGLPYRSIAALEALASLVAVCAFEDKIGRRTDATMVLLGVTDNRGNRYAVSRLMTTKFP